MRSYESKEELKNEIKKTFGKYISEFDNIPEELKDKRVDQVDRTPAENLAYQVGWTTLVLKWEEDEKKGIEVKTPSDKFKWNQLGELYQWFTDTYAHKSLKELKEQLSQNIEDIYSLIDNLTEEELFNVLCKLRFSDNVKVLDAARTTRENLVHFTVREWIRECIYKTEDEIDKLYLSLIHI